VILFIEKTWYLWWILANLVALRWFHALALRGKLEAPGALRSEEEEETEFIENWQLIHNARPVSLAESKRAF
jgi:hypothetical protein